MLYFWNCLGHDWSVLYGIKTQIRGTPVTIILLSVSDWDKNSNYMPEMRIVFCFLYPRKCWLIIVWESYNGYSWVSSFDPNISYPKSDRLETARYRSKLYCRLVSGLGSIRARSRFHWSRLMSSNCLVAYVSPTENWITVYCRCRGPTDSGICDCDAGYIGNGTHCAGKHWYHLFCVWKVVTMVSLEVAQTYLE